MKMSRAGRGRGKVGSRCCIKFVYMLFPSVPLMPPVVERETDRETRRETKKETEMKTEMETERKTERETERKTVNERGRGKVRF